MRFEYCASPLGPFDLLPSPKLEENQCGANPAADCPSPAARRTHSPEHCLCFVALIVIERAVSWSPTLACAATPVPPNRRCRVPKSAKRDQNPDSIRRARPALLPALARAHPPALQDHKDRRTPAQGGPSAPQTGFVRRFSLEAVLAHRALDWQFLSNRRQLMVRSFRHQLPPLAVSRMPFVAGD